MVNLSVEKEAVGIVEPEIVENTTNQTLSCNISNDVLGAEIIWYLYMVDSCAPFLLFM